MLRYPAVAGTFYPGTREELERELERLFSGVKRERKKVVAAVSPHAGYIYSGRVAAEVYGKMGGFETAVILGPNHTGLGTPISVFPGGEWVTPLGRVEVDQEFVEALGLEKDVRAHIYEHSIEVQVPFIQYLFPRAKIVPIVVGIQDPEVAEEVAERIREAEEETGREIVVIASSDLSHYVPEEVARERDMEALRRIVKGDIEGFWELVESGLSACGPGPITVAAVYGRERGAKGEIVDYRTSGEVGPKEEVVGYGGVVWVSF